MTRTCQHDELHCRRSTDNINAVTAVKLSRQLTLTSQTSQQRPLTAGWRFGAVVASFVAWTKLLNVEPG